MTDTPDAGSWKSVESRGRVPLSPPPETEKGKTPSNNTERKKRINKAGHNNDDDAYNIAPTPTTTPPS